MMIRSRPERTAQRIAAVDGYLREHVSDGASLLCRHGEACRTSAAAAGQQFYEAQLHHIGRHYDLEVDGRPTRIVIVGQEYGTAERHVSLDQRSSMIAGSASGGFRRRNPHMRGTTSILRLLFGREPGVDQGGEMLDGGIHLFDAFALVNYLLCTATGREVLADDKFRGAPRGRSTGAMQRNCGAHLVRVLELLEPTIIVAQGSNVRRWLADPLGLPSDGPLVETVAVLGAPVMLVNLVHPSAPFAHWWGRSATSEYLRSVVRPTLRTLIGLRD